MRGRQLRRRALCAAAGSAADHRHPPELRYPLAAARSSLITPIRTLLTDDDEGVA